MTVLMNSTLHPLNYELVRGNEEGFLAELMPEVARGSVALELSGVERIDAAGIAALITLYCNAVESGNSFSVVAPSSRVLELLRLVGLAGILIDGGQAVDHVNQSISRNCPAA